MNKTLKKIIISAALLLIVGGLSYYITLPSLSPYDPGFWSFLVWILFLALCPFIITDKKAFVKTNFTLITKETVKSLNIPIICIILVPILAIPIGGITSATIFRAKSYASTIEVTEAVFSEDMPETNDVRNVALMDTQSAITIGNRALGSLSEVVSQYDSSNKYSQINYAGKPMKVSTLEYDGFFKWFGNRKNGVPGYIMVDPVQNTAEYVKLEKAIKYTDSGYFGDDLMRKLRFSYPTKLFGSLSFEVNEEGEPFYIVSCLKAKVGLFGALDVAEVIIFDPTTGDSELYNVKDTPSWIDIVYDGHLATRKYNWYGTLSGGYFNSIIGNVGCKKTTDDFGYIVLGDDVWYFTGVTSVSADESNIGFIISNARTGEYKFYPVVGAEEYSAMNAAEGEVQEKGYRASFPSLINVAGEATYIMVLKDSGGLVKLYALVNVEQYSIVATGETQSEVMASYKKLLRGNGIGENTSVGEKLTVTIEDIRIVELDGEPIIYLYTDDRKVFKGNIASDESLITIRAGDKLTFAVSESATDGIYNIEEWSSN